MPNRTCCVCGDFFVPRSSDPRIVYCSAECRRSARRERRSPVAADSCEECGGSISGRRRNARWCSVDCNRRQRQRERRTAARSGIVCRNCESTFDGVRADQVFCSQSCRSRFHHLDREYGMTHGDFEIMLASRDWKCWICGVVGEDWHIDHCHASGEVRGILCPDCNKMLGYAKDNTDTLAAAIEYLSRKE